MSATRRGALSAALAAPLLARFTGTASADAAPNSLGTITDGWVEVRWTSAAQSLLDELNADVEAVAPATLVNDARGQAVHFPVRSGAADPQLNNLPKAQGGGSLDGGVTVQTANGTVKLTDFGSDLQNGIASGRCKFNGVDAGFGSVFHCDLTEGQLTADTVPPGAPMKVRFSEVPLRATPELMDMYIAVLGDPPFSTDAVLAYVTAEGVYNPPAAA
jgi:hypothetical protein